MNLHYHFDFGDAHEHLIHVTLQFLHSSSHDVLYLPTWINGSYLIREFARFIDSVSIEYDNTPAQRLTKIIKNQWQIPLDCLGKLVTVKYTVYAYDLSVRGAYVDQQRIYVNPAVVCLLPLSHQSAPVTATYTLPQYMKHYTLACGVLTELMVASQYQQLSIPSYQQWIDSPFEIAVHQYGRFEVNGVVHHCVLSGISQNNMSRLTADLQRICSQVVKLFNGIPFKHYWFMTMVTADGYGGLEHSNSTSLICPRGDLPTEHEPEYPSNEYQRYLGLCSHEYIHAWLVKTIKPVGYDAPNPHREQYTTMLWFFEGITSYLDDLMLYQSGIITTEQYLVLLQDQYNRYRAQVGYGIQSLSESSFDAWIKYYRPDENAINAQTSYYAAGAIFALYIDVMLGKKGGRLATLLSSLYHDKALVDVPTLQHYCDEWLGDDCFDIWARVDQAKVLDMQPVWSLLGVSLVERASDKPYGMTLKQNGSMVEVSRVYRGSDAAQAGISAGDHLVAVDGLKVTIKQLQQASKFNEAIDVLYFRRDELFSARLSSSTQSKLGVLYDFKLEKETDFVLFFK